VPPPHPWTIKLTSFASQVRIEDSDNGRTLGELNFKANETLSIFKKGTQAVSAMPLLTKENKLNDRAQFLFTQIFERYAIEDPDDPTQKVLDYGATTAYVQGATGEKIVDKGVQHLMQFDSNSDGKLTLQDFLYFY